MYVAIFGACAFFKRYSNLCIHVYYIHVYVYHVYSLSIPMIYVYIPAQAQTEYVLSKVPHLRETNIDSVGIPWVW